jgi:hypothetical protein
MIMLQFTTFAGVLHFVPMRAPGVPCFPNPPCPFDQAESLKSGFIQPPAGF